MDDRRVPRVVIVDYGVGNLFSVQRACHVVGLNATIAADVPALLSADAVIVPGVGAFGDAMRTLHRLDLVGPLKDIAAAGAPLIGICLGMQLFMSESEEFGQHQGLGFFSGPVVRFARPCVASGELKVPQVGWNHIFPRHAGAHTPAAPETIPAWTEWPLQGIAAGEFMYFVHSYYVKPDDPDVIFALSRYGDVEFCSSMKQRNIFACQFHPERSGGRGIQIYRNIARHIAEYTTAESKDLG